MDSRLRLAAIAALSIGALCCAWPCSAQAGPADRNVTLDADTFKLSPPPDYKIEGFATKPDAATPGVTLPDRVDLGGSVLRFDTSRNLDTSAPKTALDETDQSVLNPGIRVHKDSPLQPNYFGLTLTTPTH